MSYVIQQLKWNSGKRLVIFCFFVTEAIGNIYEQGSNGWLPTGDHEEVDKA